MILAVAEYNSFNSPTMQGMLNKAFEYGDMIAGTAVWVVAGFLIVKLILSVLSIAQLGGEFKMQPLWHGLFIIFLLLNFSAIFKPLEEGISKIITPFVEFDGQTLAAHNKNVKDKVGGAKMSPEDLKKLQAAATANKMTTKEEAAQQKEAQGKTEEKEEGSTIASYVVDGILGTFEGVVGTIVGFVMWLINWLMSFLIRLMILGSVTLFTVIFVFLLPLALMIDYMPGQKNVAANLLMAMIGIKFWIVTLKVIDLCNDLLMTGLTALAFNTNAGGSSLGDGMMIVIFSLILLGAYLAIPFFTNLILPSQASSVWSQGSGLMMKATAAGVSFGSSMVASNLLAGNMLNPTGKQMLGKIFQSEYSNFQNDSNQSAMMGQQRAMQVQQAMNEERRHQDMMKAMKRN